MTKEELLTRIEKAFAEVPYPGDHQITIHPLGLEEEIEEYFRGKTWQNHAPDRLRYHQDALGLFTPAGYRYFLPAFLIAALQGEDDLGWHIGFSLERGEERSTMKGKTKEQLFMERLRGFSKEQRGVLIDFFNYFIEHDDVAKEAYQKIIVNLSTFDRTL